MNALIELEDEKPEPQVRELVMVKTRDQPASAQPIVIRFDWSKLSTEDWTA